MVATQVEPVHFQGIDRRFDGGMTTTQPHEPRLRCIDRLVRRAFAFLGQYGKLDNVVQRLLIGGLWKPLSKLALRMLGNRCVVSSISTTAT